MSVSKFVVGYEENNKKIIAEIDQNIISVKKLFLIKCLLCGFERIFNARSMANDCKCTHYNDKINVGQIYNYLKISGQSFLDEANNHMIPCDCFYSGCETKNKPIPVNELVRGVKTTCGCFIWKDYYVGYEENGKVMIAEKGKDKNNRRLVKVQCKVCKEEKIGFPKPLLSHACHCMQRQYKTFLGQKFSMLTTISEDYKDHRGFWVVDCDCECGTKSKPIRLPMLFNHDVISCNCFGEKRMFVDDPWASIFKVWKAKIANAGKHEVTISFEEWKNIVQQNCYLCGQKPNQNLDRLVCDLKKNGIDRVDSSKGYISGNCKPCCKDHNYMKLNKSLEKFMELCHSAIIHQIKEKIKNNVSFSPEEENIISFISNLPK